MGRLWTCTALTGGLTFGGSPVDLDCFVRGLYLRCVDCGLGTASSGGVTLEGSPVGLDCFVRGSYLRSVVCGLGLLCQRVLL
jgi:hypothetical protein